MDELYAGISEGLDEFGGLFLLVLLLAGGLLVMLVWALVNASLEWTDQQALLREAQAIFDRVRAEDLPDLQIDPLLRSIFGEDVHLPQDGTVHADDWLYQAIFETV
jgi:hypothetical protein